MPSLILSNQMKHESAWDASSFETSYLDHRSADYPVRQRCAHRRSRSLVEECYGKERNYNQSMDSVASIRLLTANEPNSTNLSFSSSDPTHPGHPIEEDAEKSEHHIVKDDALDHFVWWSMIGLIRRYNETRQNDQQHRIKRRLSQRTILPVANWPRWQPWHWPVPCPNRLTD